MKLGATEGALPSQKLRCMLPHACCLLPSPQGTGETRFVVLVVYVGGTQAATALVDTAETNLNQIGSLIDNVAAATNNAITVQQVGGVAGPRHAVFDYLTVCLLSCAHSAAVADHRRMLPIPLGSKTNTPSSFYLSLADSPILPFTHLPDPLCRRTPPEMCLAAAPPPSRTPSCPCCAQAQGPTCRLPQPSS